jgi:predicted AlkP superfamily pyrophosphatase or phosphodiesterase
VQLVVLDGMRFDMLTRVPDLAALLEELKDDLIVRKMRAQLPTMSVPNWITLLTGAPPEWTGVLGNLLVPETK